MPPDDMALGWNDPAPASREELAAELERVLALMREGESPEGFLEWLIPVPEPCPRCEGTGKIEGAEKALGGPELDPCPAGCDEGRAWPIPELKDAEFALRAHYRVGGVGPGSGGMRIFTKKREEGGDGQVA